MMDKNKEVRYLLPAQPIYMDGIMVRQALPTAKVSQVDPFLLVHHGSFKFNDLAPAIHQGIGPHPHRGFSPVTFVIEGEVHHRDSRYHNQIAKKGDVQWMHAGAGIIHSERPSQNLVEQKGRQEIVQLWINSPAASKKKQPKYQFTANKDFPVFKSSDGHIRNRLVTGTYNQLRGPVESESELCIIWSHAEANGRTSYLIPSDWNVLIYVIKGELNISGYGQVSPQSLIVFEQEGNSIELSAPSKAEFLLLSGRPINEEVVKSGPFVMNTQTEILKAMRDYQMGKMGILIEEN